MDHGKCKEFNHPFKLLVNDDSDQKITKTNSDGTDGYFARMVKATGEGTAQSLFEIARDKYMSSK